jgi:hypothetical protein
MTFGKKCIDKKTQTEFFYVQWRGNNFEEIVELFPNLISTSKTQSKLMELGGYLFYNNGSDLKSIRINKGDTLIKQFCAPIIINYEGFLEEFLVEKSLKKYFVKKINEYPLKINE